MIERYDWWKTTEPTPREKTMEELEEMEHQEYLDRCYEASCCLEDAIMYLEDLYEYGDVISKKWTSEMIYHLREASEELKEEI